MSDGEEWEMHVPEGYKAYPRLEAMCLRMPPDGTVMEELFADPGERARASNALTLTSTEVLRVFLPGVFQARMVGTPFWLVLCETISEASVRALALGVYLGQAQIAKMKLED